MKIISTFLICYIFCLSLVSFCIAHAGESQTGIVAYNVQNYGATGEKSHICTESIQRTIDECAQSGGGMVYIPPGNYTSGAISLKSNIRLFLEAGATLYPYKKEGAYPKGAFIYGENLHNITLEGRGTIDGEAEYVWTDDDEKDMYIDVNRQILKSRGERLRRTFPKGVTCQLLFLVDCEDVRITGLSFVRSPSWTIHIWGCERVVIDGIYAYSHLVEAVWADGIDINCSKDVHISNCTVETGDDAIVLKSYPWFDKPARPTENVTVTNCRLTSTSSAFKCCDTNFTRISHVVVDNCVIRSSNRGLAFMCHDGGELSDVIVSNVTVECTRHKWFWWGDGDPIYFRLDRRSEKTKVGSIKNILISNVVAYATGPCTITGYPSQPLEGITLDRVTIHVTNDPEAVLLTENALICRKVNDLTLQDVRIVWGSPSSELWKSALYLEDINHLRLENFYGRQAHDKSTAPAIALNNVIDATICGCEVQSGTGEFLHFSGNNTDNIFLFGNDFTEAEISYKLEDGIKKKVIHAQDNIIEK